MCNLARITCLTNFVGRLLLDELEHLRTNAANWANIVLRKLWSVNLNLIATNGANKLVSSLCHFYSSLQALTRFSFYSRN